MGKLKNKLSYKNLFEMAECFEISAEELSKLFIKLHWARLDGRWWIVTEKGIKNGGYQAYDPQKNQKYILWNVRIMENIELFEAVENLKKHRLKAINTLSYVQKLEKGEKYKEFVAKEYRQRGYNVWEDAKVKEQSNGAIDLIAKKEHEIILIQCKNWNENGGYKVDERHINSSRTDASEFIKYNPIFSLYDLRFRYIISGHILEKAAYKDIARNSNFLDYEIIMMS